MENTKIYREIIRFNKISASWLNKKLIYKSQ